MPATVLRICSIWRATFSISLGGEAITTTVEGRERYAVNVRYPRDLRSDPRSIASDTLIALPNGGTVPLGEVASVTLGRGPTAIRTENGQLAVYIFIDIRDRDLGGYVADAQKAVAANVQLPSGYYVTWSGQFEYLERGKARLRVVVPVTLLIIFLLLYLNFRRLSETLIVMLSLPFSVVGSVWLLWWLGFNLSVAVAVGFIALAGVAHRGADDWRDGLVHHPHPCRYPGDLWRDQRMASARYAVAPGSGAMRRARECARAGELIAFDGGFTVIGCGR